MTIIQGADSETCKGIPITFQFFSGKDDQDLQEMIWTNKPRSLKDFLSYLDSLPTNDTVYVIYIHNLSFDLVSFFYSDLDILINEEIDTKIGNWKAKGIYANTTFLSLYHVRGHKTVHLIDTSAFFYGSLEKLAKIFCHDLPKLEKPEGLGQIKYKKSDKHFKAYAMRDAEICYHIGKYIDLMHKEFDIQQTVSIAQMAGRIFRHKFMKKPIPLPPMKVTYSALHAYHGGKNNITVPTGMYENVYGLDITSAYPYAMSLLPSFYELELYKGLRVNGHPETMLPEFGIYKVWGNLKKCKYPIIYNHGFQAISGKIEGIWTTSFELNEAIRTKEIEIEKIEGYWYDHAKDKNPSPFSEYVGEFFHLKDHATDPIKRMFYKTLLNSLYGKFIQTNKKKSLNDFFYDCDLDKLYYNATMEAGGLFNPFIAALITGHTRAYIHKLEHKYQAIHTSTDGIITHVKPKEIKGLGGLKIEYEGDALILRNKLYVIYTDKKPDNWKNMSLNDRKKKKSIIKKGKYIHKFALHGFHGNVNILEHLHKNDLKEYEYTKVNKLKESLRRGLTPNNFEPRKATLNLTGGKQFAGITVKGDKENGSGKHNEKRSRRNNP